MILRNKAAGMSLDQIRVLLDQEAAPAHAATGSIQRLSAQASVLTGSSQIESADPSARGLAVFSGPTRGLFHAVALDFPVANKLVLDEAPFDVERVVSGIVTASSRHAAPQRDQVWGLKRWRGRSSARPTPIRAMSRPAPRRPSSSPA